MRSLLLLAFLGLSVASPLVVPGNADFELFQNVTKGLFHPSELVFGGSRAVRGQFPWQVFLLMTSREGGQYICGGSLLTTRHVLTAAHCTEKLVAPSRAMVGLVNIDSAQWTPGVQIRNVRSYANYPTYTGSTSGSLYDDIAVITLDAEVTLSKDIQVVKIKRDDSALVRQPKDTVSGFGTYTFRFGQPVSSQDLLYTEVDRIDNERCRQRWAQISGNRVSVWSKQVCAGSRGKGAGPGDSGGPLQTRVGAEWFQIGLVSFGLNGGEEIMDQVTFPAVYTRVAAYCDFITQQTLGGFKCL
ncbi:hypothetical protein QR680_013592 [Steinernema hermaphroditum]|uniref:Peptidase S1 domain-containing protein n=1 Tax=Steinernema hermaphroditum TaxID=289476 RepID=A0AA39I618_9BILA|nr:hypothetical protein QR680_013592 [Steinernema hermaphroditum]